MKFQQLKGSNFMCFGEDVTIPLDNQGLVFIGGENLDDASFADSNLSGKSTFFDLWLWAVFGKTFKGVRGKDVIREGEEGCVGSLIVNDVEIRREWTKADKNMLYLDNKEVTQTTIEDFLKTDFDSFTNFVLFGDSGGEVSLFGNSTNKKQFEMLKAFLNFELWDNSQRKAKDLYDKLAPEKVALVLKLSANQTKIIKTESELNELNTKVESKQNELKTFEGVIGQQLRTLWLEVRKLDVGVTNLVGENVVIASDKSQLLSGQADKERLLNELRVEYTRYDVDNKKLENWKLIRETESKTFKNMSTMEILCQSCKYKLSIQSKSLVDFSGVDKNIEENTIRMSSLQEKGNEIKEQIEAIKEQIVKLNSRGESNDNLVEDKKELIETKNQNIEALKEKQSSFKFQIGAEIVLLETCQSDKTDMLKTLNNENLSIASGLKSIDRRLLNLRFLKDIGFNNQGCKNVELSLVLPDINKMIRNVVYSVFHEEYPLEISSSKLLKSGASKAEIELKMGNKYIQKSKSERRRIDLVIQIALSAFLPTPCNAMGFDELISSMDPKGTEIVLDLLKSLIGETVTSIFVVSHNQVEYPFDTVMTFRKSNGRTEIVL